MATTHPDPAKRREAADRLRRRNPMTPERIAQTRERTERLRREAEEHDILPSMQEVDTQLGVDASEAATGALDAVTFGKFSKARNVIGESISPGYTEDAEYLSGQATGHARPIGQALPGLAGGAAAGTALARAGAGFLPTVAGTMATEYPLSMSRRMSQGEDVGQAAKGAGYDAALTGGIAAGAGAVGFGIQALRNPLRETGRLVAAKEAAQPWLDDVAKTLPKGRGAATAQVVDQEMQSLIAANVARREAASAAYDGLADGFLKSVQPGATQAAVNHIDEAIKANLQVVPQGKSIVHLPADQNLNKALKAVRKFLGSGAPSGEQLLAARQVAKTRAGFDMSGPPTEMQVAYRQVYGKLNEAIDLVDDTGDFAKARAGYKAAMDKERDIGRLITGHEREALSDPSGAIMTEGNRLKTMATSHGIGPGGRLSRELASADPGAAESLKRIAGVDAMERMRGDLPRTSFSVIEEARRQSVALGGKLAQLKGLGDASRAVSTQAALASGAIRVVIDDNGEPQIQQTPVAEVPQATKDKLAMSARQQMVQEKKKAEALRRGGRRKKKAVSSTEPQGDGYAEYDPITGEQTNATM